MSETVGQSLWLKMLTDLGWDDGPLPEFKPCFQYIPGLDMLVYYAEDVSCITQQIDERMGVMWSHDMARIVGFQLYGFRHMIASGDEEMKSAATSAAAMSISECAPAVTVLSADAFDTFEQAIADAEPSPEMMRRLAEQQRS